MTRYGSYDEASSRTKQGNHDGLWTVCLSSQGREAAWPESQIADRFIKTGDGDAAAALAAMHFWTWQTEEVRAMLDWMRAYNRKRGKRPELSFAGFDMQSVKTAMKQVRALMSGMSAADRDTISGLYDRLEQLEKPASAGQLPAAERLRLRDDAAKALDFLIDQRKALLKAAGPEEYRDACQAARIVLQASQMYAGDALAERDRAMADNVGWLLEERFPGQKIVLWAHDGHLGTVSRPVGKTQGMHLRERYGDQMVVLGFALHHGELRAKRMAQGKFMPGPPVVLPLPPAKRGSIEAMFHEAELRLGILDLRRVCKESALGKWLGKPRMHRSIGAGYNPDQSCEQMSNLPETYDGIIFIAKSTATTPIVKTITS